MATQADLTAINAAIAALNAGERVDSMTMSDKTFSYGKVDLSDLLKQKAAIEAELGLAAGTYKRRTYCKQMGRGI